MGEKPLDVKVIFCNAVEKESDQERQDYLDEVCQDNPELRAKLEELLALHERAEGFLEVPAPEVTLDGSPLLEGPGTVIGPYKLLEKIGEGGMAVVYMAKQSQPLKRRVALKIIKLGMDTKEVIARFEAERQALALMDHPNIAKVLDAGVTDTGRPYFVMELVRGVSITEYCDKNKLTTQERLGLFVPVCNAVHHAHQKGIIHRDIKPSNVLVTLHDSVSVPKVIDFGIAKAVNQELTEKTVFTLYAQMIGTPEYMSPEQAEMSGLDVDIRTDVFSLGVLLYELLTGTTPFASEYLLSKGYAELQRIIREEEPTKPSTKISTLGEALTDIAKHRRTSPEVLRKLIQTDLDWIVMKTLEKDRSRRYDSISEFVADINRHLNHEPVLAGRPSAVYRIKKFVQRRRALVVATVAIAAVIVVGFVISTAMYVQAEQARQEKALAHAEAQTVIDFFTDDLLASVYPERAKSPQVTVRYILESAAENIEDKFAKSPLVEAKIRESLGLTYQKMGDYKAAEPHLARAFQIRREQLGEEDPNTLTAMDHLGLLYWYQARYHEAESLLEKALEVRTRVLGEEHPDTLETMSNLGQRYCFGLTDEYSKKAEVLFSKAFEIGLHVLGEEHPVVLQAMHGLAVQQLTTSVNDDVGLLSIKALEISRRVLGDEHELTLHLMNTVSWVYGRQERRQEAIDLVIEALEISQRVLGEDNFVTARSLLNLGRFRFSQGQYDAAAKATYRSREIAKRCLGEAHPYTLVCGEDLCRFHLRGQQKERDKLLIELFQISDRAYGHKNQLTVRFRWRLYERALQLSSLGIEQYQAGQFDTALDTFNYLEGLHRVLKYESAPYLAFTAMSLYQLNQSQEARTYLERLRMLYDRAKHGYEDEYLYEAERLFADKDITIQAAWGFIEGGQLDKAVEVVRTRRTSDVPEDPTSREIQSIMRAIARVFCMRGKRAEARAQHLDAKIAYEMALQHSPTYALPLHRLAWLLATCPALEIRDGAQALEYASKANELTSWENAGYVGTLAAAHAAQRDFTAAVKWQKRAIEILKGGDDSHGSEYVKRLHLYESATPYIRHDLPPLLARWTFDEIDGKKVLDSSDNNLNGQLIGDAHLVDDPNRGGRVLSLDGTGDWVDCGVDTTFNLSDEITISLWAKTCESDMRRCTLIKGNGAWMLTLRRSNDSLFFSCEDLAVPSDPGSDSTMRGSNIISDAKWHHIVASYDGTRMYLYIDGQLLASESATGNISAKSEPVYIGAEPEKPGQEWKGLIDDVRIYSYALGEADIKSLHVGEEPDLMGR